MTIAEAILRVTSQRFKRIDTGNGTSAIVPICSNPACNRAITEFSTGIWSSLEEGLDWENLEIRAFCRATCDIFKQLELTSHANLSSCWWDIGQLWQSDQRRSFEKVG